jgi:hypothetical protein
MLDGHHLLLSAPASQRERGEEEERRRNSLRAFTSVVARWVRFANSPSNPRFAQ